MLKRLAYWGSAALAGVLLGLGVTALFLQREGLGGGIASGPWQTSMVTGSSDADPWTRAQVARRGLLALAPEETLYYNATTDSEGAYFVEAPAGDWYLEVSTADGCYSSTDPISAAVCDDLVVDFSVSPDDCVTADKPNLYLYPKRDLPMQVL